MAELGEEQDCWVFSSVVLINNNDRAATELETGAQLGERFEVVEELGRGAMGVVYRGKDLSSRRDVALKVALEDGLRPDQIERMRREGELAAALDHPGIVRVFSAGEVEGRPFLVYELVEGARTLKEVMPSLPRNERLLLISKVVHALAHAHARGVVHRDLKPGNILLDAEGRPRLTDFGLATAPGVERLTRTGAIVGTPTYMAPEQIAGERGDHGSHTDVWALGVLLYEALTGDIPFRGPGLLDLSAQICHASPKPPRELDHTIHPDLEDICLRALNPQISSRYSDAGALAVDLDRYLAGNTRSSLRRFVERRTSRALLTACAIGTVGAVGAALLWTARTPTAGSSPVSSPDPAPTPTPSERALASKQLDQLKGRLTSDPSAGLWGLERWRRRHPDHPRATAARALARATRLQLLERPVWAERAPHAAGIGFVVSGGVPWIVSWARSGYLSSWSFDPVSGSATRTMLGRYACRAWAPTPRDVVVTNGSALWRVDADRLDQRGARLPLPLDGRPGEQALVSSPDGALLAVFNEFGTQGVRVLNLSNGTAAPIPGTRTTRAVCFSPDGNRMLTTSAPNPRNESRLRLWRLKDRACLQEVTVVRPHRILVTPTGSDWLVVSADGLLQRFDGRTGQPRGKAVVRFQTRQVVDAVLGPNGRRLYLLGLRSLVSFDLETRTHLGEYFQAPETLVYRALALDPAAFYVALIRSTPMDPNGDEVRVYVLPQPD